MAVSVRHQANLEGIRIRLEPLVSSAIKARALSGGSFSVIALTEPKELEWLSGLGPGGIGSTPPVDAGLIICMDYLPLKKTCPEKQSFYYNDLMGLLDGIAGASQMASAITLEAVNCGWQARLIQDIWPQIATIQSRFNLPPLVLPVSVLTLGGSQSVAGQSNNQGLWSIHWGRYDEKNLDTSRARSWWQTEAKVWDYGRAARHLALTQLYKSLDNFGLVLRRTPELKPEMALPAERINKALSSIPNRYPRALFDRQRLCLARARRYFQSGKTGKAMLFVDRAAAMDPGAPDIAITTGLFQWAQGNLEEALEILKRVQKQRGEDGFLLYLMGEIFHEQGLLDLAREMLSSAIRFEEKDENVWLSLAAVVEESIGPHAALSVFRQARGQMGPNAALLNNEGLCCSELGNDDDALACFEQALAIRPNDPVLLANQGLVLGRLGRVEAALKCFEHALKRDPNNAGLLNNKGFCLGKLEQYAEALRCYEKALINEEQSDISLLHNKATCLAKLGRHKEALACYDQVLQYNPVDTATLNNRGLCLLNLGRIRDAIACYNTAIRLEPGNAVLWGNKGASLLQQGNYTEGLMAYEKALELAPFELGYYSGKGMCLDHLGRTEEAVICYNRALRLA